MGFFGNIREKQRRKATERWEIDQIHKLQDSLSLKMRLVEGVSFSYYISHFKHSEYENGKIYIQMKIGPVSFRMECSPDELENPKSLSELWIQQILVDADKAMNEGTSLSVWEKIVNSIILE